MVHAKLHSQQHSDRAATPAEKSDVLMQQPRAGVLRPSFCLVRDDQLHCIVLAIRGTHSLKVRDMACLAYGHLRCHRVV